MNERPILTDTLQGFCRTALEQVRETFKARYPGARFIIRTELHQEHFSWELVHLTEALSDANRCHIGHGATPEEAFADLDRKLGPPISEPERLRRKAAQFMAEAEALEAQCVAEELKSLPASSPASQ
jgi:hypothetical protein